MNVLNQTVAINETCKLAVGVGEVDLQTFLEIAEPNFEQSAMYIA